ncbi:class I SAM-dependent methyltransferase [Massilia arenosa]|uniref:Class I SAM-dependent methyltransferase n=1 Tax=Zemynaea arenosa TaxID=2561931 RepID=A0A4Y9SBK6_9BURK|nr:class I SAM-dependent methyltransferase [Massilia arenosa]TFW19568.1 class I SAM-dependent methyltransferase [Massilia arenosa]
MSNDTLAAYYNDIAAEYDRLHAYPEREDELGGLQDAVADLFAGHMVLELGCGTGFWTETLAYVAASIMAIDTSAAMLAVARARGLDSAVVTFAQGDALALADTPGEYSACFIGGWWSHLPKEQQDKYLKQLRARLGADALLCIVDDAYVEGESLPIARTDMETNTWQIVTGPSGQRYEILKNYPADSSLRKRFAAHVKELRIKRTEHYWMLTGRLK